ncbi:DNA polymerase I [Benzoatithermus flavus]|uniref:DNA polymerase I n=1 Tax=Benzoatithermus flavus TaxID=3108223 RepID=A0ABU8XZY2_9PROT
MNDAAAPEKRLVLIDGSGYIFRAFFALPPMTRPDGTPVNAVFGFTNMLFKLMQERPQDDLVVVFDHGRTSFRNDLYDQYKANREEPPEELRPQFKLVRDAARALGLPVIELEGYEADDLIASYVKKAREAGEPVVIVSSDKDLMQLVGDGVEMWDPMKQKPIGRAEVIEKFGVGPELVRDALALIGDASDNVPGVPGIGPKNACQLLTEFGSLEGLLANLDKIKQPKRRETLRENAERARLSYRLVCLNDEAPLPQGLDELRRRPFDPKQLLAFLQENGFKSLAGRIEQLAPAAEAARAERREQGEKRFSTLTSLSELDAVLARARDLGRLALDTETTSLDVSRARLVGVCLAVEPGEGFYVPLAHIDEFGQKRPGQLDLSEVVQRLAPVLADPSVLKIGHNIKYDMGVLAHYGLEIAPIDDTMLMSYVLHGASHGHGMDELAKRYLDYDTIPYEAVCGKGAARIGFAEAAIDRATAYAAEDAEVTLRLWQAFRPRLLEERMLAVYETLERPIVPVIADMERWGVRVDAERLRRLSADFTQRMAEREAEAYRLAGRSFNLGSPKQLGEVLFDELGLGGAGKRTKTGAHATGADVLEELAAQGHELPRVILEWRQLQKLTRTYTDALVEQIDPDTGRVHTCFSLAATSTGRLSSTEPNLQNIPIRTEEGRKIREAFVPAEGFVLVSADYSQIELRILAHMADIKPLKEAFASNVDIHAVTASQMFGVPVEKVGADLRRSAKTINYGIVYGIGAFGLAQRLGIPQAKAKEYIESYFRQYPGIKDYMDRTKAEAREKGFVRTLDGRRCYIPEINAKIPSRRAYAERAAINAPVQGTAADIMKRAMARVWRALRRELPEVRMLLQVHDELVFEVPMEQVAAAEAVIKPVMEGAASLSVPLVVEIGSGMNWDEAH